MKIENCLFCGAKYLQYVCIEQSYLNVWRCNKHNCRGVMASYDDGLEISTVGFQLPIKDKTKKLLIHDGATICARIEYEYHAYIMSAGMGFLACTNDNNWSDLELWKEVFDFGFNNQLALYHIDEGDKAYEKLYAMGLTVDN